MPFAVNGGWGRAQMAIWRMLIACWIPNATNTLRIYVYNNYCLSTPTVVTRTRLIVTLYVHCSQSCLCALKINSRLQSGNACCHSVLNILSSSLLSKNFKIKIHRNIILPVVFYEYETWSFKLREESRLRVFENRVLRRIFGLRREEVTGEWRKLHNEELNHLHCSPTVVRVIQSRKLRWVGNVARNGVSCVQDFSGEI